MAIDKPILDFLKKHKFTKNEVISYVPMNDASDKSTLTDTRNSITKAFTSNNMSDIALLIEAIFDDGTVGKVSKLAGAKKNEFIYTNKDESEVISYSVQNDVVTFTKGNKKLSVSIELAPIVENAVSWKDQQKDIITQVQKIKNFNDFKKWAENYIKVN